jgi:TRAP-type C4-dicarboxylate transport system permease small subunit
MKAPEHEWERRADAVLGVAASAILMGLMCLTFVDVVARYVFNRPLRGGFEVTELLLLTLIFAGLPLASRVDEHVTLDFVDMLLGPKARSHLRRLVDLVCGIILLALAWRVWVKAGKIGAYGDTTDVLRVPVTPFVYFMTAMVVLTGLVHLAKVIFQPPPRGQTFDPEKARTS